MGAILHVGIAALQINLGSELAAFAIAGKVTTVVTRQ
jgi:hypothetical protein